LSVLHRSVQRGELLKWDVVLDGTFLVRFVVDDPTAVDAPSPADHCDVHSIDLPTGWIVICSADPRAPPVPVATVEPGQYEVQVKWFVTEESKQPINIESPDAYPTRCLEASPKSITAGQEPTRLVIPGRLLAGRG